MLSTSIVIYDMQNVAWFCLPGIRSDVLKKDVICRQVLQHMLQGYLSIIINGAFTDVEFTHQTMGTNTNRCWFLNFALVTIWMVFFLFSPEDIQDLNYNFSTLHQSIPDELGLGKVSGVSEYC